MTMYFIDPKGLRSLPADHFVNHDSAIVHGKPSFEERIGITADCMRATFLGSQNHDYDYLLNSGLQFAIVTHPNVTFSCQDKIAMYNENGCTIDGRVGSGEPWKLSDTVKAIYFWDKPVDEKRKELKEKLRNRPEYVNEPEKLDAYIEGVFASIPQKIRPTGRYHIAVIPGQETGTQINQDASFKPVCHPLDISVNNRIRIFPTNERLVFGVGLEGALSPLPPFSAMQEIEFIYFDWNHLDMYGTVDGYGDSKLDDLSISMRLIPCPDGQFIERRIDLDDVGKLMGTPDELMQQVGGKKIPLEIIAEDRNHVSYVTGPLFGDYRDIFTKAGDLVLRFNYVPPHMLSLVMNHKALFELMARTFTEQNRPGVDIIRKVDMRYKAPRVREVA